MLIRTGNAPPRNIASVMWSLSFLHEEGRYVFAGGTGLWGNLLELLMKRPSLRGYSLIKCSEGYPGQPFLLLFIFFEE